MYQQLLAQAKEYIVIWDPHYQLDCDRLFCDMKNDDIHVEVLTICKGCESKNDIKLFANRILSAIDKKRVPKCSVTVNALKQDWTERHTWLPNWHDRYLIVDGEVYLVGTSMDAQADKTGSFGIMRLAEKKDKNLVIDTYIKYRDRVKDESTQLISNGFKFTAQRGYVI